MKKYIYLLLTVVCCSCQFKHQDYINFLATDPRIANSGKPMFYVTGQVYTDVSQDYPSDCYMPDGETVSEYLEQGEATETDSLAAGPRRTTATNLAGVLQSLLDWGSARKLVQLPGVYYSIDTDYETQILLSGKVIMPADGNFKRYIIVSHYTIGANRECPSNCFSLEGILAKLGYCVIIPDYLGYGVSADRVHPYLIMQQTAINVIDMYYAVKNYMESKNIRPEYDDIYLMGYSQGGANTMAVLSMIERDYTIYQYQDTLKVHRVFAGGGPYDVKATYDSFVESNVTSYPIAVPLVMQGMVVGNPDLGLDMKALMQPKVYALMDKVNSKQYTTKEMNWMLGTHVTSEMLTERGMDRTNEDVCLLYKCMTENSVINMDWKPQAPVYLFHSIDDETVPYENATRAKTKWNSSNITYNFGHYGKHQNGCVRFIFAVRNILKEEK